MSEDIVMVTKNKGKSNEFSEERLGETDGYGETTSTNGGVALDDDMIPLYFTRARTKINITS